jgi:hypothetical protein
MAPVGVAEFFTVGFFGVALYGVVLYCVWKFYQILSKINDNIAGIRQAVERCISDRPAGPRPC